MGRIGINVRWIRRERKKESNEGRKKGTNKERNKQTKK